MLHSSSFDLSFILMMNETTTKCSTPCRFIFNLHTSAQKILFISNNTERIAKYEKDASGAQMVLMLCASLDGNVEHQLKLVNGECKSQLLVFC